MCCACGMSQLTVYYTEYMCTCARVCVCTCAYVQHIITMSDCLSLSQEQLQWMQDSCHGRRRIIFKAPLPVDWVLSPTSECGGVGVEL